VSAQRGRFDIVSTTAMDPRGIRKKKVRLEYACETTPSFLPSVAGAQFPDWFRTLLGTQNTLFFILYQC
jgi:hypothetical protein